ncbi:DNA polymerase III subunit epsilon [uncultured Bifidobacterium sp.]|uniref:DNA polymerase III subunit epsilon n=1 Tax=uncultured Bifidobacterium sp. TaxID=165187 RepID=UPI002595D115|nr:DNA polymerase III subunit epsilon [uncultured Bifidobacterium sp.]
MGAMYGHADDRDWLMRAHGDIDQWAAVMDVDADDRPIDWNWVRTLDFVHGVGVATPQDCDAGATSDVHDLLRRDLMIRDRLEAILTCCDRVFMTDYDRLIPSYRLPRALAYVNRRLNDEINLLRDRGVAEGLWTITSEHRERVTVPVLHAAEGAPAVDDIQDRTAELVNGRAERRKRAREQREVGDQVPVAAGLEDATGAAGTAAASPIGSDWRDVYLPGRGLDTVMGVDIETTGTDPLRDYIIDVGFEYMNMVTPRPQDAPTGMAYVEPSYQAGDAYGQARLGFGVTRANAWHGNETIRTLTGIDVKMRSSSQWHLFDEWPEAQRGLLMRLEQQPFVAHNANFEHRFFLHNVEGYAESYRSGHIVIIDTMPMSRRWDEGAAPSEAHPYGDNSLEAYAKRQGALSEDSSERHLGLEDAHIMLVAMKHHLTVLREAHRGPWGPDGVSGTGGKRAKGRRW